MLPFCFTAEGEGKGHPVPSQPIPALPVPPSFLSSPDHGHMLEQIHEAEPLDGKFFPNQWQVADCLRVPEHSTETEEGGKAELALGTGKSAHQAYRPSGAGWDTPRDSLPDPPELAGALRDPLPDPPELAGVRRRTLSQTLRSWPGRAAGPSPGPSNWPGATSGPSPGP